jgi:phosphotransferase system enzyme I (PtsI)
MGRAYLFNRRFDAVHQYNIPADQTEAEVARFKQAIEAAREELTALQQRIAADIGAESARIFRAHQAVLEDPEVVDVTIARIKRERKNAESVFNDVMQGWITHMSAIQNPFFRERTADFEDIRHRVLNKMMGETHLSLDRVEGPVILVAHNLSPSDTADIDRQCVCGFITDVGGATSHTAIVARGLGIPAVVGVNTATQDIPDGALLILDGTAGVIFVDPDEQTIRKFEETRTQLSVLEDALLALKKLPAVTQDGRMIELSANIELPMEVEDALAYGADGIGLYRTEFLYLLRHTLPTEEEQYQAYRAIAERLAPKPVIIRTLDLGMDKLSMSESHEANPALGFRGIRICLGRPEMFKIQLRAILRASAVGNLRVMFPMISGLEELRQARSVLRDLQQDLTREGVAYDPAMPTGIMIEVPSAALTAHDLAGEADFFSIGTNDLIQYTIAVDRGNATVASLYNAFHPAILRLIATVIEAGHARNIWVGICGAMASDPAAACILLGLGLDELSMSPIDIPEIKKVIRSMTFEEMARIARHVLTLPTPQDIKRYVQDHLPA